MGRVQQIKRWKNLSITLGLQNIMQELRRWARTRGARRRLCWRPLPERGPNNLLKFVEFVESRNPLQNLCFPSHGIWDVSRNSKIETRTFFYSKEKIFADCLNAYSTLILRSLLILNLLKNKNFEIQQFAAPDFQQIIIQQIMDRFHKSSGGKYPICSPRQKRNQYKRSISRRTRAAYFAIDFGPKSHNPPENSHF